MDTQTIVLIAVFVVLLVAYLMRRRSRAQRDD
jgi:hypothetical protein